MLCWLDCCQVYEVAANYDTLGFRADHSHTLEPHSKYGWAQCAHFLANTEQSLDLSVCVVRRIKLMSMQPGGKQEISAKQTNRSLGLIGGTLLLKLIPNLLCSSSEN